MSAYLVPTPKELGELIRGFRKQLGWTQAHLAEHAGLLAKTVSAIEAGNGQVLLANVMRCLSALEVDVSLASRLEGRAVPRPQPSGVGPSSVAELERSPKSPRPRRTAAGKTAAVGLPVGKSNRREAKQASDASRPDKARRASAGIKALKENW